MPDEILITIAENTRHYRLKKKMTQAQLAEKAKLSRGYISLVENAKVNMYLTTLCQIAKGLKVRVYRLVAREDKK